MKKIIQQLAQKYQKGGEVRYSELPYDEQDIRKFYGQMIGSDWYKQRLEEAGYGREFNAGTQGVVNNRMKRVLNTRLEDVQKDDGVVNQIWNTLTTGEFVPTGVGSHYNHNTRGITLIKSQLDKMKAHPRSVLTHEYGHAEVEGGFSDSDKTLLSMFDPAREKYMNDHNKSPFENKSDINALRYNLYRSRLFDPKTGKYKTKSGRFEQEMLDKAKDDFSTKRLRDHYTDETLIDILNTIASNENIPSQKAYAKIGGVLKNIKY